MKSLVKNTFLEALHTGITVCLIYLAGEPKSKFYALFSYLHVHVVLVAVLVAVGEGNDGYRVDGLYQSPLGQGLCHNFTAVVRHAISREDTEVEGVRVIGEIPF